MLTANENRLLAAKARLSCGLTDQATITTLRTYALECDAAAVDAELLADALIPPDV